MGEVLLQSFCPPEREWFNDERIFIELTTSDCKLKAFREGST